MPPPVHLHLVLKINASHAQQWHEETVINHWAQLFSIPVLVERYQNGKCHSEAETERAQEAIELQRTLNGYQLDYALS